MFCTKCGKELKDGAKFCVSCGTPVDQNVAMPKKPEARQEEKPVDMQQKPDQKKNTAFIGCGIAAALVVILYIAGCLVCSTIERSVAKEIEAYAISDYEKQEQNLIHDYEEENFFNIIRKVQIVHELSGLRTQSKEADAELTKLKETLDQMEGEKEKYDLTSRYSDYEKRLEEFKGSVEKKEYENASAALALAQKELKQLIDENKQYVEDKLNEYKEADWSMADEKDKSVYDTDLDKINQLMDKDQYAEMKSIFDEMDEVTVMYIEPDQPLAVSVQQVDVTEYPNVKLYVKLQDAAGDVPENLQSGFFYVRKKDANASYVRQKVVEVTQLNQLEALNIDMVADVSGSMDGYPLMEAKNLMSSFLNTVQFEAGDRVELTSFSTGVYLEQNFTDDLDQLDRCINGLVTDDMTSLYDALYTAVTRTASQNGAKCVIAFTDGNDNYSNCTPEQVIDVAKRYSVPIFIIGIGSVNSNGVSEIAYETGGEYYPIDSITSIKEIYDEIYRQEKELYMVQYADETGADLSDASDLIVGYHSSEYGGEENYSYSPKVLMSVNGNSLYTDGPEAVVEAYMKAFDNAMTESNFSYISDYLKAGSPIYKTQKKYVEKDISEQLESYEIVNTKYSKNKKQCVVTTRETYYVQKTGEPLNLMTQQCKYKLVLDHGEWKMTDFADSVKVLSRIKQ